MKHGKTYIVMGSAGAGKSNFINYILKDQHIDYYFIFSSSQINQRNNKYYHTMTKPIHCSNIEYLEDIKKLATNKRIVLIFEDIDMSWYDLDYSKKILSKLFESNIIIFFVSSKFLILPPNLRNLDFYIFFSLDINKDKYLDLYEAYGGIYPSYESFKYSLQTLDFNNNEFIVFDNTVTHNFAKAVYKTSLKNNKRSYDKI